MHVPVIGLHAPGMWQPSCTGQVTLGVPAQLPMPSQAYVSHLFVPAGHAVGGETGTGVGAVHVPVPDEHIPG